MLIERNNLEHQVILDNVSRKYILPRNIEQIGFLGSSRKGTRDLSEEYHVQLFGQTRNQVPHIIKKNIYNMFDNNENTQEFRESHSYTNLNILWKH